MPQSRIRHGSPYGHLGNLTSFRLICVLNSLNSELGLCFGYSEDWR